MPLNQRQPSVPAHDFGMNPRADVPRSVFPLNHRLTQSFNFSYLVPVLIEEVIPGDTWKCAINVVARTAVPIVPVQDRWHLEFFSFFIPMRLVWTNARKFWGEQDNPADSISFTVPQVNPTGGYAIGSLQDYMGLPTVGQMTGVAWTHNALYLRAYNKVYNEWFKDQNLQNDVTENMGDGPDPQTDYTLLQRGKRFDYFNQALPWPQKGNVAVTLPLGSTAPVVSTGAVIGFDNATFNRPSALTFTSGISNVNWSNTTAQAGSATFGASGATATGLRTDLTGATAATVNQLRQAITLQQYLEKDARGGTRYGEFVYSHFGVRNPDARLQRPEFIGGGHADILTTAIPQTAQTGLTGGTTPLGSLGATGHISGRSGFTYSATEHGIILTLVSARADLTYQQGMRRMWSKSTRYDYPVPLLAGLGEQTILNKEIYMDGTANDANVFGYVPRFDEYRHIPSRIAGIYRSTAAGTIDYWHSSEKFTALPALNGTYIKDNAVGVVQRNFSAGAASLGQQILADFYFDISCARALPAYGVPGLRRF